MTANEGHGLCRACFDGIYPIKVPGEHAERAQVKFDFDAVAEAREGRPVE